MGATARYFWLDPAGRVYSIPRTRFECMWNGKAPPVPLGSGQPVRFAEAIVEFVDRQPHRLRRLRRVGGLLAYRDARRFVDQGRQPEGMRLATESIADQFGVEPQNRGKVRSMTGRRPAQRFQAEHQFELTRREVEVIAGLIFGARPSPSGGERGSVRARRR